MIIASKFASSPWASYPVDGFIPIKTRISHYIYKENMILRYTPIKAVFSRKNEEQLILKKKGFMMIELIPRKVDRFELKKYEVMYDQAKTFDINPEDVDKITKFNKGELELKQKLKRRHKILKLEIKDGQFI